MGSNPFRVIPLLGISSPRRENILFQVQGAHEEMAHLRGRYRRKSGCGFGVLVGIICIRIYNFNMYLY